MGRKYQIVIQPEATISLNEIWHFYAEVKKNPAAANNVLRAIRSRILALSMNSGRPGRVDGTREIVVTKYPYIIVTETVDGVIHVLSVRHDRQMWPDIFTRQ